MAQLRKIDCVLIRVTDLDRAVDFYGRAFGLSVQWRDEISVGLGMPETDAEVVLQTRDIPADRAVNYLVDDVVAAVAEARATGCAVLVEPFEIAVGRCAVLADPDGNPISVLDLSKGERPPPTHAPPTHVR